MANRSSNKAAVPEAPEEIPRIYGSANGFFTTACMITPQTERQTNRKFNFEVEQWQRRLSGLSNCSRRERNSFIDSAHRFTAV